MSTLCLSLSNPLSEPQLHFVRKMWKSLFTFVCGIIVVSSLNVSPQKNETVLDETKNPDYINIIYLWNTLIFPLPEMDHDKYNAFVMNISTLMREVESLAADEVLSLWANNTKIVDDYIEKMNRRVLDSKNETDQKVHKILDPIERSRPLFVNKCWRIYNNSLVTAERAVKVAAETCGQRFLNPTATALSFIMQTLKDKNSEILKQCEQIRHCQGEDCQKSAEYAILNVTKAAEEFEAKFERITRLAQTPQLDGCVCPTEDKYLVKRGCDQETEKTPASTSSLKSKTEKATKINGKCTRIISSIRSSAALSHRDRETPGFPSHCANSTKGQ